MAIVHVRRQDGPVTQPKPPPWTESLKDEDEAPGHVFDGNVILLELYRLLATVLADRAIVQLITNKHVPTDPVAFLLGLQQDELPRLLLNTAVMLRARHDIHTMSGGKAAVSGSAATKTCGTLAWLGKDETEELSLREACNKIIHAEAVRFERAPVRLEHLPYEDVHHLVPVLALEGTHGKKKWRAAVNIVEYVRLGATIAT